MKKFFGFTLFCVSFIPSSSWAVSVGDLNSRATSAASVLEMGARVPPNSNKGIPTSLLKDSACIATFPNVLKAAFVVGGSFGRGLVSCRLPDRNWSEPSFITLAGGSWGFQIGVESVDLILIFMNANAAERFSHNNFTMGVDATVAAGPIGRDAQAGTDYTLRSEILSYSRANGIFAGVSLHGTSVSIDKDANATLYGSSAIASSLLRTNGHVFEGQSSAYASELNLLAR